MGLGTAGGVAERFHISGVINESWYLQIATEAGVLGLGLFLAVLVGVLAMLWVRARSGSVLALGGLCGLMGVSLAGLVLHSLQDLSVSSSVWMLAGLALNVHLPEAHMETPQNPVRGSLPAMSTSI